jgi:hypothetical protein
MRVGIHSTALVAVATVVVGPVRVAVAAPADVLTKAAAREHFANAQAAFDIDDYAAAIPELKAAYAIEPNPMLLYAWAQAERLNGDCKRAVELYQRFLATDPAAEQERLAEANVLDCQAELGAPPPPPPEVTPPPDSSPASPPSEAAPRPWARDWVGWTLTSIGIVGLAAGAGVFVAGRQQTTGAPDRPTEAAYFVAKDEGKRKQEAGAAVLGVGGAFFVAGVIRFVVLGVRSRRHRERTTAWRAPLTFRF